MTLKDRYEEKLNEAKLEEFNEILKFVSSRLEVYHSLLLEIDQRTAEVVIGDFDINVEYFFKTKAIRKIFDFNSEDGIRDFKNDLLLYLYMNLRDVMIHTENLYEHQICILY